MYLSRNVRDLDQSIRYYVDVLGFVEDFRFGDYAGLKMGASQLHLAGSTHPVATEPGNGRVYLFLSRDGFVLG